MCSKRVAKWFLFAITRFLLELRQATFANVDFESHEMRFYSVRCQILQRLQELYCLFQWILDLKNTFRKYNNANVLRNKINNKINKVNLTFMSGRSKKTKNLFYIVLTLSSFSGINSSNVGCSRSGSFCCRDLLCCSRFSWAWAACCRSSSAFLRCFLCLFLNFFNSDGAKFSVTQYEKKLI